MEKFEKFLPLLATVLTAGIGAAGVLLQEWRQKRDDRYRRNRARTEATEMVVFIEKWIATQKLACSPDEFERARQTARQQLERVYFSLVNIEETKRPIEETSFFQRLLLLYKPATLGGWALHFLFYFLVMIVLLFITIIAFTAIPENRNLPDALPLPVELFMLLIVSLVMLTPALAIRAWAIAVDRKHRPQPAV